MHHRQLGLILAAALLPALPFVYTAPAQADAPTTTQPTAAQAALPVTKVQLFSSGVGYFEHAGVVSGDGSTELRFTTDQINDVLKSLVLQDQDGGQVKAVTYPSSEPLAHTLGSFAIDISKNPSLADLLNQLRGAKVGVDAEGGFITGTILGVENHTRVIDGSPRQTMTESMLNLLADGKIVSKPLGQVRSVTLDDPHLQQELNKALAAVAGARDKDKKTVTIIFTGRGDRHVRIGYVVQTPVWKTSYRLLLDQPTTQPANAKKTDADKAQLQGWAIVENQTDNDWHNVQLSLVSGEPISFIEDLYQPIYLTRPTVNPQRGPGVRPQSYAGGMMSRNAMDKKATAAPKSALRSQSAFGMQESAGNVNSPIDALSSIRSMASASMVGQLFHYTVDHVSLPRRQSSLIPIVTDPIKTQQVSIYNQSVLANHPLNGARLTNTTHKDLLAGPMTVLDGGAYAGDAQIENFPQGQTRLISYAVDLQVKVDPSDQKYAQNIQTARIVKGTLILTQKMVRSQTYVVDNQADKAKTVVIEHPRQSEWSLVDTPKPAEVTPELYRFDLAVPANQQKKLAVGEQLIQDESIIVTSVNTDTLAAYRRSGQIPGPVLKALTKAISLGHAVADTKQLIARDKSQLAEINTDQTRIRGNIRAIQPSSKYYERLMKKLNDQETQIDQLESDQSTQQKKLVEQEKALADYVNALNVE